MKSADPDSGTCFSHFRAAVQFITLLPAGPTVYSPTGMIPYFPLVGLLLGGLLLAFDWAISFFWPPLAVSVLDVALLAAVTGAFHLDGLGDTADGLFSHRSRDRMLTIMKDSRIGMMALVTVIGVLAVKVAGIFSIKTHLTGFQTLILLWIIPSYSRASMIFGIRFLNYGRTGTGTGLDLFKKPIRAETFGWLTVPVAFSLALGRPGLVVNLVFVITLVGLLGYYKRKMNCITGDMLGAMNEIMEAVLFLAAGASLQ